jgi:hypothetical protein
MVLVQKVLKQLAKAKPIVSYEEKLVLSRDCIQSK